MARATEKQLKGDSLTMASALLYAGVEISIERTKSKIIIQTDKYRLNFDSTGTLTEVEKY